MHNTFETLDHWMNFLNISYHTIFVIDWQVISDLEAFPVNNGGTTFIIFLFGNPHLLEC